MRHQELHQELHQHLHVDADVQRVSEEARRVVQHVQDQAHLHAQHVQGQAQLNMQHAEVQAQRHALEVEAQAQRAVANTQSQASEFALHARDAVLQANREIDMLRQQLQQRDQTIDRLTRENTRMQANNGADHTPAASRPPLLPTPSASGHSPSQASHVESQGSIASELRNEMREELRESRNRMHEAVVTMTQQVGEAMQTMQQQINVLTAQVARSSHESVEGIAPGTSSHASRAFAAGDPDDDDDDDDDNDSDDGDDDDDDDDDGFGVGGLNIVASGSPGGSPHASSTAALGATLSEDQVYKNKDLSGVVIPTLPSDAASYRGWKNSLIAKLASLDRTGDGVIMRWIQEAFQPSSPAVQTALESSSGGLPRLDAWIAGQLGEPKHMHGEIGLRFQSYLEKAQVQSVPLRGRMMLHEVAKSFALDRMRGANLTQQALLELPLESFSQSDLRAFFHKVEYILNSIPPDSQPSEQTKFVFLYERLKRCNGMRRHVDKIRDSAMSSKRRSFGWLWRRFSEYLDELREDANQDSIRKAFSSQKLSRKEQRQQAAAAAAAKAAAVPKAPPPTKSGDTVAAQPAAPPKKPTKGTPKGNGKGGGGKTKGHEEQPKTAAKAKYKAPCLFFPTGSCTRGENCPFSHDTAEAVPHKAKPKAQAKGGAAPKAPAKATAAAVALASLPSASSMHVLSAVVRACTAPLRAFTRVCAFVAPMLQSAWPATVTAPSFQSSTATPALQSSIVTPSCYEVEWIADSGAGRGLGSSESLLAAGIPSALIQGNLVRSAEPIDFATGGGRRTGSTTIGLHGDIFGRTNTYMLGSSCPLVRSLGQVVEEAGMPFIWLPGGLPYFAASADAIQIACDEAERVYASRVEQNVPIFKERVQIVPGLPASAGSSSPAGPVSAPIAPSDVPRAAAPPERPDHPSDADSEGGVDAMSEELKLARSVEHRLAHFPKSLHCPACKIAKCYRKRIARSRPDPLAERGLDPVTHFGERIAVDFIVVSRSAEITPARPTAEHYVLVIRDEFSGFLLGIPCTSRDSTKIATQIRRFLGPRGVAKSIICKADNAKEFEAAAAEVGVLLEPSLENYFPHNSVLERDVRTYQEAVRATHIAAGFTLFPELWTVTCQYVSVSLALSRTQPQNDDEADDAAAKLNRLQAASGEPFTGPKWLLGQLIYYRVNDKTKIPKFSGSCLPGIFAGWRLDSACRYRGVVHVLDYEKLKTRASGFENLIALPQEEVVVDGPCKLPLHAAQEESLAKFSSERLEDIPPISVPFTDAPIVLPTRKRAEYITLERIIKFGPTDECRGCSFDSSKHNSTCRRRFDALIKADREAREKATRVEPPTAPEAPADHKPAKLAHSDPLAPPRDDPRSHEQPAMPPTVEPVGPRIGGSSTDPVFEVVGQPEHDRWKKLGKARKLATDLPGVGTLVEYAHDPVSLLSQELPKYGLKVLRLSEQTVDLSNPQHILQVVEQLKAQHGADLWISLPSSPWSNDFNMYRVGDAFPPKLQTPQRNSQYMLELALQVAEYVILHHGRVVFEWPAACKGWRLPQLQEFLKRHRLYTVRFDSCKLGRKGRKQKLLREQCLFATNDRRVVEVFSQYQCDHRADEHEPAKGNVDTAAVGSHTLPLVTAVVEALFPRQFFQAHVPALSCKPADGSEHESPSCLHHALGLVTMSLTRKEWQNDPEALKAIQQEAQGLRNNETWDDSTACDPSELKAQARALGIDIKIAELLTLCGIKHAELDVSQRKYKGRIVYRGDKVLTQDGDVVFFNEVSTTPTTLTALNVVLWWGAQAGHTTTTADAVQAFLQSSLPDAELTYVVLPPELWLKRWTHRFRKVAVRLRKSLYGHPQAGRLWQDYLLERIKRLNGTEMPGFPSNFVFKFVLDDQTVILILNVYVDDLTLSGPKRLHERFWKSFCEIINTEPPQELTAERAALVLGRLHTVVEGLSFPSITMCMQGYAKQLVDLYIDITQVDVKCLRHVGTPHVSDSSLPDEMFDQPGALQAQASRILMKALWLARLCRPDISFAVGRLASRITVWTRAEDVHVHRLISYVYHTQDYHMLCQAGPHSEVELHVYADADLASCVHTARSTSGMIIMLVSGDARWPIAWQSRRQSSVARSTTEAEIISMSSAVYGEAQPLLDFLSVLCQREVILKLKEDNEATLSILLSGYSVKLRHASRTHRINLASLAETIQQGMTPEYTPTDLQAADGLTKVNTPQQWQRVLQLLCVREPSRPE